MTSTKPKSKLKAKHTKARSKPVSTKTPAAARKDLLVFARSYARVIKLHYQFLKTLPTAPDYHLNDAEVKMAFELLGMRTLAQERILVAAEALEPTTGTKQRKRGKRA